MWWFSPHMKTNSHNLHAIHLFSCRGDYTGEEYKFVLSFSPLLSSCSCLRFFVLSFCSDDGRNIGEEEFILSFSPLSFIDFVVLFGL